MIRFIDLRHHERDIGERFAWWCTITDQFITRGGEQAWTTMAEFRESFLDGRPASIHRPIGRFEALAPEWAFQEPSP